MLPQPGFDHLQVGSLTGEGCSMDGEQAGEEVAEVAAEIGIELPVGIDVQELADCFNGQNFAVGQRGRGTALAQLGAGLAEKSSMVQKTVMMKLSRSMAGSSGSKQALQAVHCFRIAVDLKT